MAKLEDDGDVSGKLKLEASFISSLKTRLLYTKQLLKDDCDWGKNQFVWTSN